MADDRFRHLVPVSSTPSSIQGYFIPSITSHWYQKQNHSSCRASHWDVQITCLDVTVNVFFICNLYIKIYIYNYIQYHFTQVHWTLFLLFDQNVNKQEKTFNLKENTHTQVFADRKCLYKVRWSSWIQVQKLYTASDCHLVADEVIYCRMKQQETFEVFMYYTKNIINVGSFTLLCVNIYLYLYFI